MKSLKVKLVSIVSAFILALSLLIVGVWAVGQSQTITMEGSVNFDVADKSLYVKDVRMQEDNNSTPYSLIEQDKFMPGYINGNFNMDLGEFTNDYGTFALYFDIINTMNESTSETFAYTVDPPTQPSNGTATITILDINGETIDRIPQGTVKPSQISDSTQASATIKLTIASTSSSQVDLSEITITIKQFIPQIYNYFTFKTNEEEKTATLTGYDSSLFDGTDIVIPSKVDLIDGVWQDGSTYAVTAIASVSSPPDGVFYNSGITSVELPSTLESIGEYAFFYCSGLTSITLPDSLTSIGDNAFQGCSGFTSITLPEGLTSIGDGAFSYCSGLTSITLPDSLTSIGDNAFQDCRGLTSITLPSGLTNIGIYAFEGCSGLESITVEEGNSVYHSEGNCLIETASNTLLRGCKNSIIPSYITSIGDYAFSNCSSLTSITLPEGLTSVGNSAFYHCSGLKEVIINSEFVYTNAISTSACGSALNYATTVKVLSSLVKENHKYINSTNFPNVTTEVIEGKSYTVYSKN